MKKLGIVLCLLVLLFGCAKAPVEVKTIDINSYAVDMSGYKGVTSTNHQFKGISPEELLRIIEEDGSAVIYMGFLGCHVCQEAARYINETAEELGVTVYYLDCSSELYPLKGSTYEAVVKALTPILMDGSDGGKSIFTPHVFSIVNGELNKGHISLVEGWMEGNPGEKEVNALKDIYRDIMSPFQTTK